MKYERIIIASIVCITAIVCCWIIGQSNRWQYVKLDGCGFVLLDTHNGASYRAVADGGDRAKYVRETRER